MRVQCNTTALSEHLPPVLGEFLQSVIRVSVDLEERPSHEIATPCAPAPVTSACWRTRPTWAACGWRCSATIRYA